MAQTYSRLAIDERKKEKTKEVPENIVYTSESDEDSERTEKRSEMRTPQLPIKRQTKRYSFEFYVDQLTRIKKLKYQAEMNGQKLNQSDIVRQAVDDYLDNLGAD